MTSVSFVPVFMLLAVLSIFVTFFTNRVRFFFDSLREEKAKNNMPIIYGISGVVGLILSVLLKANIFEILKNPENPAIFLSPRHFDSNGWGLYEQIIGIVITSAVLAFLAKLWNDLFDLVYEFKRWLRKKNNK